MGVQVLPPDMNASEADFTVEKGKIRFGLASIRHVSRSAVQAITAERAASGPFHDLHEMCSRVEPGRINKLALESLARAGALSCFKGSRAAQVAAVDQALDWGARVHRDRASGQSSLFGTFSEQEQAQLPSPALPTVAGFSPTDLLQMEKDLLGVYLSGHPLEAVREKLAAVTTATAMEVIEGTREDEVIVGGIVISVRRRMAKSGKMMAYFMLEDLTGVLEATLLPDPYEKFSSIVSENAIVVVKGRSQTSERRREEREEAEGGGRNELLVEAIARLEDPDSMQRLRNGRSARNSRPTRSRSRTASAKVQTEPPEGEANGPSARPRARRSEAQARVHIRVPTDAPQEAMGQLKQVIWQFRGDTEVLLHLQLEGEEHRLRLGPEYAVEHGEQFEAAVLGLLGEGAIWLE